jgi:hypothetical protein
LTSWLPDACEQPLIVFAARGTRHASQERRCVEMPGVRFCGTFPGGDEVHVDVQHGEHPLAACVAFIGSQSLLECGRGTYGRLGLSHAVHDVNLNGITNPFGVAGAWTTSPCSSGSKTLSVSRPSLVTAALPWPDA